MKNLYPYFLLVLLFSACEKESGYEAAVYKIQKPDASFTHAIEENGGVVISFSLVKGSTYVLDFGNGKVRKDSLSGPARIMPVSIRHAYANNGPYKISLTVTNTKGKAVKEQVFLIGNVPPPPLAAFRYELKEGGVIELQNLSKNASTYTWRLVRKGDPVGYNAKVENPTFTIENNGLYYVYLQVASKYQKYDNAIDSLSITHAKNINNPTFEGAFFDKQGKLTGEGRNSFDESYGWLMLTGAACNSFLLKDIGNVFIVTGNSMYKTIEERYWNLRQRLTVGPVDRKFFTVLVNKEKPVWVFENGKSDNFNINKDPDSIFEITEAKEVDQPKLTSEMFNKAFLVTFRIKVDLGPKGKIDGLLKMKYMIY